MTIRTRVGVAITVEVSGRDGDVTTTITALGHTTVDHDTITLAEALADALMQAVGA